MDLFKLQRVLNSLQDRRSDKFGTDYKPFLGVSLFDNGKCLLFNKKENVKNWCKKFKREGKLYFFIANTSTSDLEHWILIAFESDVLNTLYVFNSFGIVNTLKTFGYENADNKKVAFAKIFDNVNVRINAVLELSRSIWYDNESCCELPKIRGINGIHQDYSTDECGYHVLRFAIYLFYNIIPKHAKHGDYKSNWSSVLDRYFFLNNLNLVRFDYNKFDEKTDSEAILLKNDKSAVHYIESSTELKKLKERGELIEAHYEDDLSVSEWENIAKNYIKNYDSFNWK